MINSQETIKEIAVFNLLGQHIKNFEFNFKSGGIDLSELNKGAYIFNLKLIDGTSVSTMIFKK